MNFEEFLTQSDIQKMNFIFGAEIGNSGKSHKLTEID